jgi:hypothetical protein
LLPSLEAPGAIDSTFRLSCWARTTAVMVNSQIGRCDRGNFAAGLVMKVETRKAEPN